MIRVLMDSEKMITEIEADVKTKHQMFIELMATCLDCICRLHAGEGKGVISAKQDILDFTALLQNLVSNGSVEDCYKQFEALKERDN